MDATSPISKNDLKTTVFLKSLPSLKTLTKDSNPNQSHTNHFATLRMQSVNTKNKSLIIWWTFQYFLIDMNRNFKKRKYTSTFMKTWDLSWLIGWLRFMNHLSWKNKLYIWLWFTWMNSQAKFKLLNISINLLESHVFGLPANIKKSILPKCTTMLMLLTIHTLYNKWKICKVESFNLWTLT